MIPAGFYVTSLVEHISLVERVGLVRLPWLFISASAILNHMVK